ncbi:phenylalanine--tRNA ligase subunit alpha [Patescibacteria group bacterium]|nr:phenylalanine--tRNA ligase subunit alpha [Patescibacteria group bacterium]
MELENIKKEEELFLEKIQKAPDVKALEAIRIDYLGRKGKIAVLVGKLPSLSTEKKREFGSQINSLKQKINSLLDDKLKSLEKKSAPIINLDLTAPGKKISLGHRHILSKVEKEVRDIFLKLNFSVIEGPEVESEYYNFDALNIPPDHPAREMWDTFWLKESKNPQSAIRNPQLLMRTHTSPMQIRFMEAHQPPFQVIVPGRVFRYEATDASHEINFYQVEGLMVGKDVSLANFKFIIEEFFRKFFPEGGEQGKKIEFRFRPSYFPFVEPGVEVDIKLPSKKGETKWLEVMGAGMVHRAVFEAAHYNPDEYQGFAFGVKSIRLAMIKYKIPDIRLFYSGDLRFIKQF